MELKELEKLFKICRKQGVTDLTFGDVVVRFGDLPEKVSQAEDSADIQTDELSPDELIFHAVGGYPE